MHSRSVVRMYCHTPIGILSMVVRTYMSYNKWHGTLNYMHKYSQAVVGIHTCLTINTSVPFLTCTHIGIHLVSTCSSI